MSDVSITKVLGFWLDETGPSLWYNPPAALDQTVRDLFMQAWIDAPGLTAEWAGSAEGALASLILTDQFPRNMFRNDARAFATDPLARRIADAALGEGHDLTIEGPPRQFFYLPFTHSEDLADQDRAVALYAERLPGEHHRHAELHRDAIRAFGRFPWRNEALGRHSTPEEQALLDAGGYGAMVRGEVSLAETGPAD